MRVLIVEDKIKMAEFLKKELEDGKHCVSLAFDGRTGLKLATFSEFDAIVVDVTVQGLDGLEVVRRVRRNNNRTPILVITAQDSISDISKASDLGADDFLTKPFSFVEFLARLRAIVRRSPGLWAPSMKVADLVLDPATRRVCRGNLEIRLSPIEYKLLLFLVRRSGRVVSRDTILDGVWGFGQHVEENTLDVFISVLRGKVDRGFKLKLIRTIKGVGYSIREEIEA
jgi:DNA-binding response OmpR family regulator